jgi:peptidyl-prolyl cis-trans isomerase C
MTCIRMTRIRLAAGSALLALALGGAGALAQTTPAPAPAPDTPVAKIDGTVITERDLTLAAEDLGQGLAQMPEGQRRDYIVNYLADLKFGAKAAADAKVADQPEFKKRLEMMRDKLLVETYLDAEAKKAVTDEAMKKLYADSMKDMKPEEEVHARHILVETEDQAKDVAKRVKGGEDFAKVAAEVSKDPGSGKEGGDLGYFTRDRMVPEFADAAFKMDKGQISDPVKSQFGWHVIKVEDKRTKPLPSFDDVKDQVQQYLIRKTQSDLILALRSKGKVERLDKPAAAAPAAPAADAAKPADAKAAEPAKP